MPMYHFMDLAIEYFVKCREMPSYLLVMKLYFSILSDYRLIINNYKLNVYENEN